jgi:hypothetical protein
LVELLECGIGLSQGLYPHTHTHTHRTSQNRINTHIYILVSSWIRTYNPSISAGEESLCLRPHSHCDWLGIYTIHIEKPLPNTKHALYVVPNGTSESWCINIFTSAHSVICKVISSLEFFIQ